jgi:hypothetical protein
VNKGRLLAVILGAATVVLVVIGTCGRRPLRQPTPARRACCVRLQRRKQQFENLGDEIRAQAWQKAYASLANKAQFTEPEFVHDLTGYYPSLLTYSTLDKFEVRPLHASADEAEMELKLHWATVVGPR